MEHTIRERRSVFIGGASRSGTTMLGAMLGSHSAAIVTPESQFKFDTELIKKASDPARHDIFTSIESHPRFKVWDLMPNWDGFDGKGLSSSVLGLVDQYAANCKKSEASFWIDHTPTNLRYSQFLDQHYPGCLFIHIVRDGRAVMASQFALDWGSNDPIFASLKWIEPLCVGLACEAAFKDRCIRIQYEELVKYPEKECRRICDFLNITFEPNMIAGADFRVPSYTESQHQLVGQAPDPQRIDDWQNALRAEDIRIFESMTFDLLPMMGYEKKFPEIVEKPKEFKQIWILFKGALKYLTVNAWLAKRRISAQKRK